MAYSRALSPPLSRRGYFCLLPFGPEPVRTSLDNQVISDSSKMALLTPSLVWTLGLHALTPLRTLRLKPSTDPGLLVAGLQAPATTPGRQMSFETTLYSLTIFALLENDHFCSCKCKRSIGKIVNLPKPPRAFRFESFCQHFKGRIVDSILMSLYYGRVSHRIPHQELYGAARTPHFFCSAILDDGPQTAIFLRINQSSRSYSLQIFVNDLLMRLNKAC